MRGGSHCAARLWNFSRLTRSHAVYGRSRLDDAAMASPEHEGSWSTHRWPARGHECHHTLGFVWILWAADSTARTLESRCGGAAPGRHRKDSRRLETSAQRSVHLCAEREARGPLPEAKNLRINFSNQSRCVHRGQCTHDAAIPSDRRDVILRSARLALHFESGLVPEPIALLMTGERRRMHARLCFHRQPSAGATPLRIASITCTLYSTPNWFGIVSSRVSASAMASSFLNCSMRTSGSAA
jgi:hypothetical protein